MPRSVPCVGLGCVATAGLESLAGVREELLAGVCAGLCGGWLPCVASMSGRWLDSCLGASEDWGKGSSLLSVAVCLGGATGSGVGCSEVSGVGDPGGETELSGVGDFAGSCGVA